MYTTRSLSNNSSKIGGFLAPVVGQGWRTAWEEKQTSISIRISTLSFLGLSGPKEDEGLIELEYAVLSWETNDTRCMCIDRDVTGRRPVGCNGLGLDTASPA